MKMLSAKKIAIVLALLLIVTIFLPIIVAEKVFADTTSAEPTVKCTGDASKDADGTYTIYYNQTLNLSLENFSNFDGNSDRIYYSYIKKGSEDFMYTNLPETHLSDTLSGTSEKVYTVKQGEQKEIGQLWGAGTFIIQGFIFKDESKIFLKPVELKVKPTTQSNQAQLTLEVEQKEVKGQPGDFSSYVLTVNMKNDNNIIKNDTDYNYVWYLKNDASSTGDGLEVGRGKVFTFYPTEASTYNFKVKEMLTGLEKSVDSINTKKDFTLYIILVVAGVVLISTTGVIISTVSRVRKEKVW